MIKKIFFTFLISLVFSPLFAQAQNPSIQSSDAEILIYTIVGLVLLISILVLLVSIYTLYVVRIILRKDKEVKGEEVVAGEEKTESESLWIKISKSLTRAKPVEEEEEILLDHSYDGIRELDNHLPPWWKWLFYITIFWSVIYLLVYHVFNWLPLSDEEYQVSLANAESAMEARVSEDAGEAITESNVTVTEEPSDLEEGKSIFNMQCAVCHREDGGGSVGPNLTDDYWVHGGSINDLYRTVKNGVPQKGMISWESQLSPSQMRNVSSYILVELVGTSPPDPKEAEGELYQPEKKDQESEEEAVDKDTVQVSE